MVVLALKDGLGNQLFQYAAARCLAEKLKTELKIDVSSYRVNKLRKYSLDHFKIRTKILPGSARNILRAKLIAARVANRIGIKLNDRRYMETAYHFTPDFFELTGNVYIEGYWQSEKYFLTIEKIIREEFVVASPPDEVNRLLLDKMRSVSAVSLHVRRGDYVTDKETNALHGVCSLTYYRNAISYIMERVTDPEFFVFSDDQKWVKENLKIPNAPVYYMDHNGSRDYEDLRLMYSCKHNILANSSFSWWGAWLNSNPTKIVIAPDKWVQGRYHNPDLIPASWIRLDG